MKKFYLWIFLIGLIISISANPYYGSDIELNGAEYSSLNYIHNVSSSQGWIPSGDAIYTAWGNQWIEYQAYLNPGTWNIGINATNAGNLDPNLYPSFQVINSLSGATMSIPASATTINSGYSSVNISSAGTYTARYTWTNDWCSSGYDANIKITSAFFDKTSTSPVPLMSLGGTQVNFGNIRVGSSGTQAVTITNDGNSGTTLTGEFGIPADNQFLPAEGSRTFSIAYNNTASHDYIFSPVSRGVQNTNVAITSNDSQNPETTVALTGNGVGPVFSSDISNNTIDFGYFGDDGTQTVRLSNLTSDSDLGDLTDLTILGIQIINEDGSLFALGNYDSNPIILGKNEFYDLTINIVGNGILGTKNAALKIFTDQNAAFGETGSIFTYNITAISIPEPASLLLSFFGVFALIKFFYKKID